MILSVKYKVRRSSLKPVPVLVGAVALSYYFYLSSELERQDNITG